MVAFVRPLRYPFRVLLRQLLLAPFWQDSFPDGLSGGLSVKTALISAHFIIGQRFGLAVCRKANGSNLPLDGSNKPANGTTILPCCLKVFLPQ
jgi:hypothetical protein